MFERNVSFDAFIIYKSWIRSIYDEDGMKSWAADQKLLIAFDKMRGENKALRKINQRIDCTILAPSWVSIFLPSISRCETCDEDTRVCMRKFNQILSMDSIHWVYCFYLFDVCGIIGVEVVFLFSVYRLSFSFAVIWQISTRQSWHRCYHLSPIWKLLRF